MEDAMKKRKTQQFVSSENLERLTELKREAEKKFKSQGHLAPEKLDIGNVLSAWNAPHFSVFFEGNRTAFLRCFVCGCAVKISPSGMISGDAVSKKCLEVLGVGA
jgi:hypothetical protein